MLVGQDLFSISAVGVKLKALTERNGYVSTSNSINHNPFIS